MSLPHLRTRVARYTTPPTPAERVVDEVRSNLRGTWHQDPDFFTKLFPVDDDTPTTYSEHKKRLRYRNRWIGISASPKSVAQLYNPIKNLLNSILRAFNLLENSRRTLNTSKTALEPDTKFPIHPPLLLAGSGGPFLCSTTPRPMPEYQLAISPLEVYLHDQDETTARDRLAVYMQQMFEHQHNRRFAYGLVISQHTLTVYMFDRSGVVSSPPLDYHANPHQFCALISGLGSINEERFGLDTSMFRDRLGNMMLRTQEAVGENESKTTDYTVLTNVYHSRSIVGRGTSCFIGYEGVPKVRAQIKTMYVIKDTWTTTEDLEGKESEASLITHAKHKGVLKGIPQIRHTEQLRTKDHTGRMHIDTILNNRMDHSEDQGKFERVHSRIIMTPYGKPLDRFSNRKEILFAYHDALQGKHENKLKTSVNIRLRKFVAHRNLHDIAGILHRDIKPGNIVINPRGEEGDRGTLIDFDHAIRMNDTSPYSTKRKIGTYLFMSRNALNGENPHSCMDDLESFYYALLYITLVYSAPGCPKETLPKPFDDFAGSFSFFAKEGFFGRDLDYKTEPWFGASFERLLGDLHFIFKNIRLTQFQAARQNQPPPVVNAADVYEGMLSRVRQAIDELSIEELPANASNPGQHSDDIGISDTQERAAEEQAGEKLSSIVFSWMERVDPNEGMTKGVVFTLAALRPRRKGANYGVKRRRIR